MEMALFKKWTKYILKYIFKFYGQYNKNGTDLTNA